MLRSGSSALLDTPTFPLGDIGEAEGGASLYTDMLFTPTSGVDGAEDKEEVLWTCEVGTTRARVG